PGWRGLDRYPRSVGEAVRPVRSGNESSRFDPGHAGVSEAVKGSTAMNRRFFLKSGSIALASVGMSLSAPGFLQRVALANTGKSGKRKTLIAIFQRGAVDGLNMVVPFGESAYYSMRRMGPPY